MGDEKQPDDAQTDLSSATESLKIEADQKENGDATKSDKVKSKLFIRRYIHCELSNYTNTFSIISGRE